MPLDRFQRVMHRRPFDGVVLVSLKDEVIFEGAYGIADFSIGTRVTMDHAFPVGSITKPSWRRAFCS